MTREEGIEVFRQFLKDNGAYEAWIEETSGYRSDTPITSGRPDLYTKVAFGWLKDYEYWLDINNKWEEYLRQNNL